MALLGYTNRTNVENFIGRTFPGVSNNEFDSYIGAAEIHINNYTGYNSPTTVSGMLTEVVTREKSMGKIDNYGNMVIDLRKPPIHFDANFNPLITLVEYNVGSISVSLTLTDGTSNAKNTIIEVAANRKKVYYPQLYIVPALQTVTPTAKINLYDLKSTRFWTDISYTGGYDTIPDDITLATNYIVAEFLLHRENPLALMSMSQGSMSQTFTPKSRSARGQKLGTNIELAHALLQPYVITYF